MIRAAINYCGPVTMLAKGIVKLADTQLGVRPLSFLRVVEPLTPPRRAAKMGHRTSAPPAHALPALAHIPHTASLALRLAVPARAAHAARAAPPHPEHADHGNLAETLHGSALQQQLGVSLRGRDGVRRVEALD